MALIAFERIPKEIKKFIRNRNITKHIFTIQAYASLMHAYFCVRFIDFMLKCISSLEYNILISLNKCEKNDKIILKYSW